MNDYSLHFLLSLLLATLMSFLWGRECKKKYFAFFFTPILFYILFYNYDYVLYLGENAPILIAYSGAIYTREPLKIHSFPEDGLICRFQA